MGVGGRGGEVAELPSVLLITGVLSRGFREGTLPEHTAANLAFLYFSSCRFEISGAGFRERKTMCLLESLWRIEVPWSCR